MNAEWNNGWNEEGDEVKATLESGRCRGNVKGVEWRAWSVVNKLWKMAA